MVIEGLLTMVLLTADRQSGSLDIDIKQEDKKSIHNDLNQYDTTLFDKDSEKVNDKIKANKKEQKQKLKNNMFQNQVSHTTRLDEAKKILFASSTNLKKSSYSDKSPYIQSKQKKNILPYALLGIGAFLTIGVIIFSIRKGIRKT
ncbi:type VII secretion protein EssA [Staphylococcus gallinarum]|uniref:type VII secretion protein EssA n=1 Tax=Staphylococcus TaxID=1279 RepID=UPI000D1DB531|nr:type VII secretion protein EssA [Staphylococcus gallinarum]MCD8820514.1 type VII secretion protein EssA [Staphylococcus gallinarum]PTK91061.1 type VII secretion protein EssA [Staphylococcus gallinarum]PTL09534.1 type VII secretion protein EssA [Staphylococcus gallinarum]PTL09871.1 type VII secretion protein EssA [Staphylococcus gallinarum]RIL32842.1 type VII secretion protein EssA [Staphylococcus gallinarum]